MSEWKEFRMDEIALIVDCEHKTAPLVDNSNFYSVRTSNISNGKIDFEKCNRVSQETYQEWTKREIPTSGDLVLAREAPVGEIGLIKTGYNVCLGQRTVLIRIVNPLIFNLYLLYYLINPNNKNELIEMSGGSVVSHLNMKDIRSYSIRVPNIVEQTAIASVLSSLDDKIDLLHRQNATLEKMAETLFRQWFVVEAKEDWDSDILGNVFDIGIGRTPPRKEHHWFSENPTDIKWVSIKDMGTSGVYISSVSEYLTQDAVDRFNIPIIPENTVMLSFKMTIGRLAISTENMLSNEAIAHFKVKKNSTLFSEFLYLYLKTYQWEQLGSTSSIVEAINSQMIKEMEIFIPEEKTLNAFKEVVEPYFKKIKSNQTQIHTLTALRDTLLPKLMSGEVRIKN